MLQLIFCLFEMSGDEECEEGTEDRLNAIDRGGLWHVSDQTYSFFYAIKCGTLTSEQLTNSRLIDTIKNDEDVVLYW